MTTSPLAVLGGSPAVTTDGPHFTWPPIRESTRQAVARQIDDALSIYDRSGVVARLEDALQDYLDIRHVLLTSSGTVALYSAYAACGIGPGDEVIVPAYTFLATATPLFHLGAIPVLADCDNTGNIDVAAVEARISFRTKAIMVTHMWGIPCDMAALSQLAAKHGIMLLEDASHAHGAASGTRKVGTFGTAAFSLNGPKPLSAGEGGLIATDDDEVYYRALLHGHYNKRCRNEIPSSTLR